MKTTLLSGAIGFAVLAAAGAAGANPIERACNASGRAASRSLCSCIGQVAERTLSGSDQRRAAKFFTDPAEAQKVRASDRRSNEAFWERYSNFGSAAETYCSG
jgi:hypothetical protein